MTSVNRCEQCGNDVPKRQKVDVTALGRVIGHLYVCPECYQWLVVDGYAVAVGASAPEPGKRKGKSK